VTSIRQRLLVYVCVLAFVGGASACGADPSGPVAAGGPSTSTSAAPADGDAQAFCGVVQQQRAVLQGTELSALLTGATAAAWMAYLDKATAMNQQLVDAAPTEIRPSVQTLQATTMTVKSTLAAVNYDVSKIRITDLIKVLQAPDQKAASVAVVAYVKAHCGIDLTTTAS
jgi:hypothetical protein